MITIETEDLTKRFNDIIAIDRLNLSIEDGEVFGLLGPNGAGKTTIVRVLMCLLKPDSGKANICGHDIYKEPTEIRSICGFLPTSPGLYEKLTAIEYLHFFGELHDIPYAQRQKTIRELLRRLGIWHRREERLSHFSTGMQQKINIVRTFIHKPKIIFLDEPTAGLDPTSVKIIREYLMEVKNLFGRTIFMCTHNLYEAEKICNRIAIIKDGRILKSGAPDKLKDGLFKYRTFQISIKKNAEKYLEILKSFPGIEQLEIVDDRTVQFKTQNPEEHNPKVSKLITDRGSELLGFKEVDKTLEDVYLEYIGRDHEDSESKNNHGKGI